MLQAARLVAYDTTGNKLGFLPYPLEWQASLTDSTTSALSLSYTTTEAGGEHLKRGLAEGLEVALEISNRQGAWIEPPQGRYLFLRREADPTDATGTLKLELPGYAWLLQTAIISDAMGGFEVDKRIFQNTPAGKIIATLIAEARARGALSTVELDFTAELDSAGQSWDVTMQELNLDVGATVLSVLEGFAEQGILSWQFQERTLQVFNAHGALERRLDQGKAPVRLFASDFREAPQTESIEALASHFIVRTVQTTEVMRNELAPTPWGRWERYQKVEGVGGKGTVKAMVQAAMERASRVTGQLTRDLVLTANSVFLPVEDYSCGDWILAPGPGGKTQPLRVRQFTISSDSTGLMAANVVLGDRFTEYDEATQKTLALLTGGATIGGANTSGGMSMVPDPAAPVTVVVGSRAYIDQAGRARATANLSWNLQYDTARGAGFVVEGRNISEGGEDAVWRELAISFRTGADIDSLPAGTVWEFRVAGFNGTKTTPWVASERVTLAKDSGAGDLAPTPGLATSKVGLLLVEWDGQVQLPGGGTGGTPADFGSIEVGYSTSPTPPQTAQASMQVSPCTVPVTGIPKGTEVYVWTRLVDTGGNRTEWVPTSPAKLTVRGIDAPDLEADSITANEALMGLVIAGVARVMNLQAQQISGQTGDFVKAFVKAFTADSATVGTFWADLIVGRTISADMINGGTIRANTFYLEGVKVEPATMSGMGSIQNPYSYGGTSIGYGGVDTTSVDANSVDAGNSVSSDTASFAGGKVRVNTYGNLVTVRIEPELIVVPLGAGYTFATGRTGFGALTHDGLSLARHWSKFGIVCNGDLDINLNLGVSGTGSFGGKVSASNITESSAPDSKMNIEELRDVKALLDVPAIAYRAKSEVRLWAKENFWKKEGTQAQRPPLPRMKPGFMADDLEAAGLGVFVDKDADGKPCAVSYSRLGVGALQIAKGHEEDIATLKEQVAALTARLEALEAARD